MQCKDWWMRKKDKYGPQIGRLPFASITYSVTTHCDTAELTELLHPHNIPVCIQLYSNVIWNEFGLLCTWRCESGIRTFFSKRCNLTSRPLVPRWNEVTTLQFSSMWNSHTASYYYYYHCLYSNNKRLGQGWSCALTVWKCARVRVLFFRDDIN